MLTKFRGLWVLFLLMALPLWAKEIIVLKNGQRFSIQGSYEIKGSFLVFTGANGQLQQLPLRMVDLEKSKQMTADYHAQEAARLAAQEAKLREEEAKSKYSSMAEIADYVEKTRGDNNPRPSRVVMDGEGLEKYSGSNPRPQNTEASVSYATEASTNASTFNQNKDELSQQYLETRKEIDRLQDQIQQFEDIAQRFANESAFGDEPTGAFYREMERTDQKIQELKTSLEEKRQGLRTIETQARRAGIGNIERVSGYQGKSVAAGASQAEGSRRTAAGRERETTRKTSGRARGDDDQ